MLILGTLYFALSESMSRLFADRSLPILIWPASGLALAGLMMGGMRLWPGIFLAAVASGIVSGAASADSRNEGTDPRCHLLPGVSA